MAKRVNIKSTRPKLFKGDQPKKVGRKAINDMRADILDNLQLVAQSASDDDVYIKRMPNYLEVTEKQLEKQGVIDLKKAFAKSPKRKPKKDGGWYLIVPIRIKAKSLSRKAYVDLRKAKIPEGAKSVSKITDYLDGRRRAVSHPSLKPKPMSKTTSRVRTKNKNKSGYMIFRTVSNTSPANAWILNRDKVTNKNFSKTTLRNIERLMKWKLENMK